MKRKDIHAIIDYWVTIRDSMQDAYDNETNHSRNRKVQLKWDTSIETNLIK
ncbi:hypothetical protein [Psychroserpens sp. SPM9]|uniref:hypothetical protein n=1 Tax=Psychroserpens sp. SPM9 TaxID=2975598 RepID=UPI0021A2987A|nr:hypothetical protein [Psychroserpens sp. SPM9]MDG5491484.1 hypothetical protein [Psychroserpens sp. SPM9]